MDQFKQAASLSLFIFLSLLFTSTLFAQKSPIGKDSIAAGDDILFLEGLETQNRSVIDTTAKMIFYQYVNDQDEVRDSSIARHMIVKAYKNIQGRRRLDAFKTGTKVRWKQFGQRKIGFVDLYSGAKENVDIMYYSDTLIEKVQIPVQYISPVYGEPDRFDTIKLLNQIWEADEALFMFPIKDSIEYCYPLLKDINLTPTYREKKVQFIFTDLKFAMLMKDDLQTGIVGKWKLKGDEIHITTAVASLPEDEEGNKKRLRCSDTYVYKFRLRDEGKVLQLKHLGPLPYVPEVVETPPAIDVDEKPKVGKPVLNKPRTDKPRTDRPVVEERPVQVIDGSSKVHPWWRNKY